MFVHTKKLDYATSRIPINITANTAMIMYDASDNCNFLEHFSNIRHNLEKFSLHQVALIIQKEEGFSILRIGRQNGIACCHSSLLGNTFFSSSPISFSSYNSPPLFLSVFLSSFLFLFHILYLLNSHQIISSIHGRLGQYIQQQRQDY